MGVWVVCYRRHAEIYWESWRDWRIDSLLQEDSPYILRDAPNQAHKQYLDDWTPEGVRWLQRNGFYD